MKKRYKCYCFETIDEALMFVNKEIKKGKKVKNND